MHHTITQNGALYALQHLVSTQPWNKVPLERASAREKSLPPRLGVNTVTAGKLKTEKLCFI
jgi:hypothetical protein